VFESISVCSDRIPLTFVNKVINLAFHQSRIFPWWTANCLPPPPHRIYHKFDLVAGIAFSDYPERSVDGSISTGRASHSNQVKVDDPDKKGLPRSYRFGFRTWGWQPYPTKYMFCSESYKIGKKKIRSAKDSNATGRSGKWGLDLLHSIISPCILIYWIWYIPNNALLYTIIYFIIIWIGVQFRTFAPWRHCNQCGWRQRFIVPSPYF
jgi:hypothetical protein